MKITIKKINIDSKIEKYMFFAGIAFYIISNTYFGWNKEAQSGAEKVCDIICGILAYGGGFWWMVNSMVTKALNSITEIDVIETND